MSSSFLPAGDFCGLEAAPGQKRGCPLPVDLPQPLKNEEKILRFDEAFSV
jgi:hypothetical protein